MYNKITLVGRIGQDPSEKTFSNGNSIVNLSVATSETYKNKQSGEWDQITTWHRIVVHGQTGGFVLRNCHKGDLVVVEGMQLNRSYESDGETKYISEVKVGFNGSITKLWGKGTGDEEKTAPAKENAAGMPWD